MYHKYLLSWWARGSIEFPFTLWSRLAQTYRQACWLTSCSFRAVCFCWLLLLIWSTGPNFASHLSFLAISSTLESCSYKDHTPVNSRSERKDRVRAQWGYCHMPEQAGWCWGCLVWVVRTSEVIRQTQTSCHCSFVFSRWFSCLKSENTLFVRNKEQKLR